LSIIQIARKADKKEIARESIIFVESIQEEIGVNSIADKLVKLHQDLSQGTLLIYPR